MRATAAETRQTVNGDAVLDTALTLFAERGYHGTALSQIAEALRIRTPSLYNHMSSKQELLRAIIDRTTASVLADFSSTVASTDDPVEKLRVATRVYAYRHATADPAAEIAVVAAALGATVHIAGPGGERETGTGELFSGLLQTTLGDDEMITSIDLPVPERWGFAELSRRHGDFGLVVVAVAEVAGRWRVAIGGVDGVPYRADEAEAVLADGPITTDTLDNAAAAAAAGLSPASDVHASAGYRRAMAEEFTRRALRQATGAQEKGAA